MSLLMVARVPAIPKRRNGTFKPGHKLNIGKKNALGNRGPQAKLEKRFITATLRNELLKSSKGYATRVHKMVDAQIKKAEKGDTFAFNSIADRIEGRPTQAHEHSGKSGGPIGIVNTSMSLSEMMRAYAQLRQEDDE